MTPDSSKLSGAVPWWLVLLQGLISILVGVLVLASPGSALIVIVRVLGWYWLIRGIFSLTAVFHPDAQAHRGWLILNSVLGIMAGFIVLDHPLVAAVLLPAMLVTCLGIAGLLIGVNDLVAAFRGAGWGQGLLGVLSIVLGGALLGNTMVGVAVLPLVIGISELVGGLIACVVAFRLRPAQP